MRPAVVAVLVGAVCAGAFAYKHERDQRREDVAGLEQQLQSVERNLGAARRQNSALSARVRGLSRRELKAGLARTTPALRPRPVARAVDSSAQTRVKRHLAVREGPR